jgi:hypothetical protein
MSKTRLPSLDEKLDEALKETFPASDAFALVPDPVDFRQTEEAKTNVAQDRVNRRSAH